jgi:DNA-binding transcriptional LysR family regulator
VTFHLLVVPGVIVDRWARTWSERRPGVPLDIVPVGPGAAADALLSKQGDAGLIRLPVDKDTFHAIPLWTEETVVMAPREHLFAAAEGEVFVADLADETLVRPLDDVLGWESVPGADEARPADTAEAVEFTAAGGGVLVVPRSLARLHHRKDLVVRTVPDAPTSSVGLVWERDSHTELVEEWIGIVRGRTANSTRGQAAPRPKARKRR